MRTKFGLKNLTNTGENQFLKHVILIFTLITNFRMRAQNKVKKTLEIISVNEKEGEMSPLIDIEIQHCAAVIAAAFLNPRRLNLNLISNSF
jgi:hypothetical protein